MEWWEIFILVFSSIILLTIIYSVFFRGRNTGKYIYPWGRKVTFAKVLPGYRQQDDYPVRGSDESFYSARGSEDSFYSAGGSDEDEFFEATDKYFA